MYTLPQEKSTRKIVINKMTSMMKVVIGALGANFICVLLLKDTNAQMCKKVWNDTMKYPEVINMDIIIAYNISGTKTEQTCFDVIDHFTGVVNDSPTFKYKIGGVPYERQGKVIVNPDKTVNLVFKDSPDEVINLYWEAPPNGVLIVYFCLGNVESILIGYRNDLPHLAAEADAVAKTLTDNDVANYKISREGC